MAYRFSSKVVSAAQFLKFVKLDFRLEALICLSSGLTMSPFDWGNHQVEKCIKPQRSAPSYGGWWRTKKPALPLLVTVTDFASDLVLL